MFQTPLRSPFQLTLGLILTIACQVFNTTLGATLLPPNIIVVTPGDTSNRIEWSPVPNAKGYHVKNASRRSSQAIVVSENIATTSWTHEGLRNNRRTYYSVSALNADGESIDSVRIEVTPSAPVTDWLSAGTSVEKLAGGMIFTEGPVWSPDEGGKLIFSDINANRLYQWSFEEGLKVFRDPSENANGNTIDLEGRLLTCEHRTHRITLTLEDGSIETLLDSHDGKRLNSPNDVVVKSDRSIWFTDPTWGLSGRKELDGQYVFRYDPSEGTSRLVASGFVQPNGLAFSPDESILYVAESSGPLNIRAFDVQDGGLLTGDRIFAKPEGTPDGMRVDAEGRLFTAAADVFIHAPDGTEIGRIDVPETPANLCFGGPNNEMMFITARTSLYGITRRPDLVVQSIHPFPENPVHADKVSFQVVIKNQGTGPTTDGQAIQAVFRINGFSHSLRSRTYTEALPAGASILLSSEIGSSDDFWNSPLGSHTVEAAVNENEIVSESLDNNNTRGLTFDVGPRSALSTSDRSVDKALQNTSDRSPWRRLPNSNL
jgi:gluconolactonase